MTSKNLRHYRPFIVLLIFLIFWGIVPVCVKRFLRVAFYEFQAPLSLTSSYVRDVQDYWALKSHSKSALLEAGRDLARTNAAYALALQEKSALKQELEDLEALLNLPPEKGYRYEIARVVERHPHSWWQELILRKGSRQGIVEGAGVVFEGGVVGRVTQVYLNTCRVQLLSHPEFRITSQLEEDGRVLVYQGSPHGQSGRLEGIVKTLPLDLTEGPATLRRLQTSRLGGVFPDGIHIGWVETIEKEKDGLFGGAQVRLDERLRYLKEVAILVPEN